MAAARRLRLSSYSVFWIAGLIWNACAAAQQVCVAWEISDDGLSTSYLAIHQVGTIVATLLGVYVGAMAAQRIGRARALRAALVFHLAACAALLVALHLIGTVDPSVRAGVVILGANLIMFGVSAAGPSWLTVVAEWPGSREPTSQLLYDSAQFQAGRIVGPLAGALALTAAGPGLQGVVLANAASCLMVLGSLTPVRSPAPSTLKQLTEANECTDNSSWITKPLLLAYFTVAAFAASVDASRLYLAKAITLSGGSSGLYSACVTAIAAAAFLVSLTVARLTVRRRRLLVMGLVAVLFGLVAWAGGAVVPALFIAGSLLIGVSVALVPGPLNATVIGLAHGGAERALAVGTVSRNMGSLLGGAAAALLIIPLGPVVFLVLSVPVTVMLSAFWRLPDMDEAGAVSGGTLNETGKTS